MAETRADHLILQALLVRGPIEESLIKSIILDLTGVVSGKQLDTLLRRVNESLEYLKLEVRRGMLQSDGVVYIALVNKVTDDHAKLGTKLTHFQVSYFKNLIETIALNEDGSGTISSIEALNLNQETQTETESQAPGTQLAEKKLTTSQKEETLKGLVEDLWLSMDEGKIGLGIRSYLELRSYLRNIEGVSTCDVCNEAAIVAQLCPTLCGARLHHYCVKLKFQNKKIPKKCPNKECNSVWEVEDDSPPTPEDEEDLSQVTRKRERRAKREI